MGSTGNNGFPNDNRMSMKSKSLEKAILVIGIFGIVNFFYAIFINNIFKYTDLPWTLSTMTFAYLLPIGPIIIFGTMWVKKKSELERCKTDNKAKIEKRLTRIGIVAILCEFAAVFIAAIIVMVNVPKEYEVFALFKSGSIFLGLIAAIFVGFSLQAENYETQT